MLFVNGSVKPVANMPCRVVVCIQTLKAFADFPFSLFSLGIPSPVLEGKVGGGQRDHTYDDGVVQIMALKLDNSIASSRTSYTAVQKVKLS